MPARFYLYTILVLAIAGAWLVDRTRQFDNGKAACSEQIANAQADYEKRYKEEQQKKIEATEKEATKATEHIGSLQNEKDKAVEKTRVIIKTVPAVCSKPSTEWMRDYNEALNSLQGH